MHKDNTPNFQTKLSKLAHFNDFINHSQEEKDELKKVKRSFTKNDAGVGTDIGNKTKYKYNKVTRKMDDDSLPEIQDDIKALDDLGEKDTDHKYKIVSNLHQESFGGEVDVLDDLKANFRSWEMDHDSIEDAESLANILIERHPEAEEEVLKQMAYDWVGCEENDEYLDESHKSNRKYIKTFENFGGDGEMELNDMQMQLQPGADVEFESPAETQNYMFFNNLETIERDVDEMLQMDQDVVNSLLNEGHNWAEDHISTSKEIISQVYDFLMNQESDETANEDHDSEEFVESENYMFFANLKTIHNQVSELLELDHQDVDDILLDGHDWAEDHIAAAQENIAQVYDLLKSEIQ